MTRSLSLWPLRFRLPLVICALATSVAHAESGEPNWLYATAPSTNAPLLSNRGEKKPWPKLAVLTTVYYQNAHSDMIAGRVLETETLDYKGRQPELRIASLYVDQRRKDDKVDKLVARHGFRLSPTIADALTLGTDNLAVDGVLLIAEHGDYPISATGQVTYPKRRFFEQVTKVFESSAKRVPVFSDKHICDNWQDINWIIATARRLKIPLMAGSSLPVAWRDPPLDVDASRPLKQIVALSYGSLDAYGFHAIEVAQSLAERRKGGETGIRAVQCYSDAEVWQAGKRGVFDQQLFQAALDRQERKIPKGKTIDQVTANPELFVIDYVDGLRVCVFTLNPALADWTAAWRYDGDASIRSLILPLKEERPLMSFAYQVRGIESFMKTGVPAWPIERTILSSGALDALLVSKQKKAPIETPYLRIAYRPTWKWTQPPPQPPGRPLDQQ